MVTRKKAPSKARLQKRADNLWQLLFRGSCEGHLAESCDGYLVVGHHIIYKSQSNRLRYETKNGIRLCRNCHAYAHRHPNIAQDKITKIIGQDRMDWLLATRSEYTPSTVGHYKEKIEELSKILIDKGIAF